MQADVRKLKIYLHTIKPIRKAITTQSCSHEGIPAPLLRNILQIFTFKPVKINPYKQGEKRNSKKEIKIHAMRKRMKEIKIHAMRN